VDDYPRIEYFGDGISHVALDEIPTATCEPSEIVNYVKKFETHGNKN